MKRKISQMLMLSAILMSIFQACSKDDQEGLSDTDLALAQDDAYTYALYEEVDQMVMDELAVLDAGAYFPATLKSATEEEPCYTVDVDFPDSTRFPKVITLDYGDGCTIIFRNDTITRKGVIQVTVTDRWFTEGAQHIVTFIGFSINGAGIEGTRTITNKGFNDSGNLVISAILEGGKVTFSDGMIMTIDASYEKEWIRHLMPQNDTLVITGSASGVNILGENFSRVITEPLILVHCREYRWRWVIIDGAAELTNSTTGTTTIDYSAENCDGTVIVNKNGYRHNYFFKYNHRHHNRLHRQQ